MVCTVHMSGSQPNFVYTVSMYDIEKIYQYHIISSFPWGFFVDFHATPLTKRAMWVVLAAVQDLHHDAGQNAPGNKAITQ